MISNGMNVNPKTRVLMIFILLAAALWGVYGQAVQFDFVNFDDPVYITQNSHIQTGMTPDSVKWAFSTTYFGLWNPLVWLSFMVDYELHGLNARGYHLTNLILHFLSVLLLMWLLNRMTKALWPSAFAAALFALHPMHVESVAWLAERKNVLSAFFWMLSLCLYVYYTEKPAVKRYLTVLFAFILALMSKPMVVTLPFVMILLDYWPLRRLEPQKGIMDMIGRQLKEKTPFFILSTVFIILTLNIPHERDLRQLPMGLSLANASVSAITYPAKTLWPQNMAVFYPFPDAMPLGQISVAVFLLIMITAAVILTRKRFPFLFVGWFWYVITIIPVLGIIHIADFAMADRYYYLPSIGIGIMMAWGIPQLLPNREIRGKILFPAAIVFLAVISLITWRQCGTWRNSTGLWMHALKVTKNNALAYNNLGYTLFNEGKVKESIECYNRSLGITKGDASAYNKRGIAYASLGRYQQAISDFSEAIRLKAYYAPAFYNRGNAYKELGQYEKALKDFDDTIRLSPYYTSAYNMRADIYLKTGKTEMACPDAQKACEQGDCRLLKFARDRKYCR